MEDGRQCSCGAFGHLEAYASATALVKRAEEALERGESSVLREALAADALTGRAVSEAAASASGRSSTEAGKTSETCLAMSCSVAVMPM